MSLGAQSRDVLRLILAGGLAMVSVGVAFGLGIATALSHSMNRLLFGIGAFDAPSFLASAALLMVVAMTACLVPASRATRVDPAMVPD